MMKWNHLPVPGGLYAQSPKFLDDMSTIAHKANEAEARRQAKQERELAAQRRRH